MGSSIIAPSHPQAGHEAAESTPVATRRPIYICMNSVGQSSHASAKTVASFTGDSSAVPWRHLQARIRAALAARNFYVANSEDLSLLWRGERIDATERRRRITFFAAQRQWRVEIRTDGSAARFQIAAAYGFFSREVLSRNHE
jgi:hypothetical protein